MYSGKCYCNMVTCRSPKQEEKVTSNDLTALSNIVPDMQISG